MERAVAVYGRAELLSRLRSALATDGARSIILCGEAGIGKTTLIEAATSQVAAFGWSVARCMPTEPEQRIPFAVVADLVRPWRLHMERLQPPLRTALESTVSGAAVSPQSDASIVGWALLELLQIEAAERRVLIVVDDVQWVDAASATAMTFALRRLSALPVHVLFGLRTGSRPSEPVRQMWLGLPPPVITVDVGGLNADALHEILAERCGRALPPWFFEQVYRTSGGNPFVALQLATTTATAADGTTQPLIAADDVIDRLVINRLDALPGGAARELLTVAAAGRVAPAFLDAGHLRTLVDEGLVVESDDARVRCAHPLIASAVYGRASPAQRRKAHSRLASVLDEDEAAMHLARSVVGQDAAVAERLAAAAERAAARGATAAAADLAFQAWRRTPVGNRADAFRRVLRAAEYGDAAGDAGTSARALDIATELAENAQERAEVLVARADTVGNNVAAMRALLADARIQGELDQHLSARINELTAFAEFVAANPVAAEAAALAAADAFSDLGDHDRAAHALVHAFVSAEVLASPNGDRWLERMRDEERLADNSRSHDGHLYAGPAVWSALRALWRDQPELALTGFCAAEQLARERGDLASLQGILLHRIEAHARAGDASGAREAAHALRPFAPIPGEQHAVDYVIALADEIAGDLDAAIARAKLGKETALRHGDMTFALQNAHVLGRAELAAGRVDYAWEALTLVRRLADAFGQLEPGLFRWHADYVQAALAVGAADQARTVSEQLAAQAADVNRPAIRATALRTEGLLLSASGDLDGALARLGAAAAGGEPTPEHARSLLAYGAALRRRRQRGLARSALVEALSLYQAGGMRAWAELANREIGRLGLTAAPPGLSPTEQRVADLVRSGCTNREISERLSLSVKTVEANLSRIYRKLGVRSRTELAARDVF